MKRILAIIMVLAMVFAFAACKQRPGKPTAAMLSLAFKQKRKAIPTLFENPSFCNPSSKWYQKPAFE